MLFDKEEINNLYFTHGTAFPNHIYGNYQIFTEESIFRFTIDIQS